MIGQAHERLQNFRLPRGSQYGRVGDQRHKVPKLSFRRQAEPSSDSVGVGLETQTLACVPLLDGNRRIEVIEVIDPRSGRTV